MSWHLSLMQPAAQPFDQAQGKPFDHAQGKPIVRIPEPCSQSWEAMKQLEGGQRYCGKCCHAVTDFTGWEPTAILNYLKEKKGEKVCGRFDSKHVLPLPKVEATPEEVVRYISFSSMNWLQKIAAIVIVCVSLSLASCSSEQPQGKVINPAAVDSPSLTGNIASGQQVDTTQPLGLIALPDDTLVPPPPPPPPAPAKQTVIGRDADVDQPEPLMGDPAPIVQGIEPAPPPPPVPKPGHQVITTLGGPVEISDTLPPPLIKEPDPRPVLGGPMM